MKWHEIKVDPVYFQQVLDGEKTFMIRRMDRDYQVGDFCKKREFDRETGTYSGRFAQVKIKSMVTAEEYPDGLKPEMGVMSIQLMGYGVDTEDGGAIEGDRLPNPTTLVNRDV